MSPVGHPLNAVENEEGLILVLADVMEFHDAIFKHCNVLHRDILVNNILVVCDFEGKSASRLVRGLLINYDHAICVDQQSSSYSRRSRTLSFVSIHNMEAHESQRTALDDRESLVYVICWLVTFDINKPDSKSIMSGHRAKILKWRKGDMKQIAYNKRDRMYSLGIFRLDILAGFQGKYRLLKLLAVNTYNALFQHQGCEGALIQTDGKDEMYETDTEEDVRDLLGDQPSAEQPGRDPLVLRKENEKDIIRTLLTTTQNASQRAQRNLEARAANEGSTATPVQ